MVSINVLAISSIFAVAAFAAPHNPPQYGDSGNTCSLSVSVTTSIVTVTVSPTVTVTATVPSVTSITSVPTVSVTSVPTIITTLPSVTVTPTTPAASSSSATAPTSTAIPVRTVSQCNDSGNQQTVCCASGNGLGCLLNNLLNLGGSCNGSTKFCCEKKQGGNSSNSGNSLINIGLNLNIDLLSCAQIL